MYVRLVNGKPGYFPYSLADLKAENPGTSFPDPIPDSALAGYDVYPVTPTDPPSFDSKTHKAVTTATEINGDWIQQWEAQELPEDRASSNVRAYRNQLLADCDWTQLADAPVDSAAWASYRQDLRDVTAQAGFPWDVQWPQQP